MNDPIAHEALERLDHLLSAKNVVGEPIRAGDATVVPLMAVGFGFGGGHGGPPEEGGDGAGVGGGAIPVALVVVDKDGVRIERLRPPSVWQMAEAMIERARHGGAKPA